MRPLFYDCQRDAGRRFNREKRERRESFPASIIRVFRAVRG